MRPIAIRALHLWVLAVLPFVGLAQGLVPGEVTFLTASNVYVRFASTQGIAIGDTLVLVKSDGNSPCLVVGSKSSTSCVCTKLQGCKVEKGDAVGHMPTNAPPKALPDGLTYTGIPDDVLGEALDRGRTQRIRGRVSAASYSTLASDRDDDHRLQYRLALNADHIANSHFSAETYLNYRQLYPAELQAYPQQTTYFNVYSMALNYAPDSTLSITLGRKTNLNASSIGPIDGLQAEKYFGKYYAGAIIGSRPDIATFTYAPELFEYGAYLGAVLNGRVVRSRTTLGLLQQNNTGAVDRRYTYFQHTSSIGSGLNLFSSFELDLYNQVNGSSTGGPRLTNLYLSLRQRINRRMDVFASYDNRKRIVYYETYRTEVEMLLEDDEARQGARIRLNVRPVKGVNVGAGYSKRFQSSGLNPSDNVNVSVNWSGDPTYWGRWSLQLNRNESSYMRSDVFSIRHSRALAKRKLNVSGYFRLADYAYTRSGSEAAALEYRLNYYGMDLSCNIARSLAFTVLGELSTNADERNYRVNLSITKRFDSKR